MKTKATLPLILVAALLAPAAFAQEPIMYPNRGQSMEQLEKDKYECYEWAKKQSGFDPLYPPEQEAASPGAPRRDRDNAGVGTAKGAITGALLGAGLGALFGGRRGALGGAAIGGVGGAIVGGSQGSREDRYEDARREAIERKNAQLRHETEGKRDVYDRAFEACLEGRGYTIK